MKSNFLVLIHGTTESFKRLRGWHFPVLLHGQILYCFSPQHFGIEIFHIENQFLASVEKAGGPVHQAQIIRWNNHQTKVFSVLTKSFKCGNMKNGPRKAYFPKKKKNSLMLSMKTSIQTSGACFRYLIVNWLKVERVFERPHRGLPGKCSLRLQMSTGSCHHRDWVRGEATMKKMRKTPWVSSLKPDMSQLPSAT